MGTIRNGVAPSPQITTGASGSALSTGEFIEVTTGTNLASVHHMPPVPRPALVPPPPATDRRHPLAAVPMSSHYVATAAAPRVATGITELDRVLGGGLVDGAFVLLGADPGSGKSTLALQTLHSLVRDRARDSAVYASGEESVEQIMLRAMRLGLENEGIHIAASDDIDAILGFAGTHAASALVIDSIQKMRTSDLDPSAGEMQQIKAVSAKLAAFARETKTPVIAIGQVTKDGTIAGPKSLEHEVDVVLYLETAGGSRRRLIAFKNRYGAADEMGLFEMGEAGLACVDGDLSQLSERAAGVPGSAVFPALLGERVHLVEVQALVGAPKPEERPKGSVAVSGVDAKRVQVILAILARHAGIDVADRDVFVSVTAGMRIADPAADLAIALAIASSYRDLPIDATTACFGELGLAGEVRGVAFAKSRADECTRQRFAALEGVKTIADAIAVAIGEAVAS